MARVKKTDCVGVDGSMLNWLLQSTQRKQIVSGKPLAQVHSCLLEVKDSEMSTTSLVRDGKTSLSHFNIPCDSSNNTTIPIPDIERMLGALKFHGNKVHLFFEEEAGKLRLISGNKQTTLKTNTGALAYPNSRDTITNWVEKSHTLAEKITEEGYKMSDGSIREPMLTTTVNAKDLFEALRCDTMNGQKLNRYTLSVEKNVLMASVGEDLKGRTESILTNVDEQPKDWSWSFEGGLDNVASSVTGDIVIDFLDFRPEGQGIRMVLWLNDCTSWVYQAGVVR